MRTHAQRGQSNGNHGKNSKKIKHYEEKNNDNNGESTDFGAEDSTAGPKTMATNYRNPNNVNPTKVM